MSKLERKMICECVLKPWFWWRFLDDVFLIRLHGRNTLIKFLEYVNSYHQNIKCTWSFSDNEISYLDVKVEIKENRIITDVYCKETDTHQYLDYRSCHPKHVKMGIPYGQALRLRRICELDEVFVIGKKLNTNLLYNTW